jgi:hypothetical protein
MLRIVELIERNYDEKWEAERLSEWGEMPLMHSEKLVVISKKRLALYMARLEEVENELCQRTVDEALEEMKARGIKLLSPEDLEDEEASQGRKPPQVRRRRRTHAPKSRFLDMFGGLFAKRTKQAG